MTTRRFPRTIRLDGSDARVFPNAATAGEWAVPGGFRFADITDPDVLDRQNRLAFAQGWLGLDSLGFSTFVEVVEIEADAYGAVVDRLVEIFVSEHGAPSREAARPVAEQEAAFASGLCDHKVHTLLALERDIGETGLAERFRVINPGRAEDHARIWEIVPDE